MNLSNIVKASDREVEKWLTTELELTPYQKDVLDKDETIRLSPFYFYKIKQKEKVSFLWRFTILVFHVYLILIYSFMPIKMIFTGKWGYGRKFIDNFHLIHA